MSDPWEAGHEDGRQENGTSSDGPSSPAWPEIERLFQGALALPAAERADWLERCGTKDAAVLERVRRLLRAHDAPPSFLAGLDADRATTLLEAWAGDPAEVPELAAGDRLGRYRIERVLARGGMGVVYLGHDPELDRPVALKVLPPLSGSAGGSPAASAERLLGEARAASALDHPRIGTVYEIGEADDEGRRFIAMAWYGGGTLRDRLAAGALPAGEALEIARQVAEGLGAAHARGLVHRDVKPENVVFDTRGRAKIVDFGLASWMDEAGGGEAPGRPTGGTAPYMSPEQRRGDAVDARTDVWALGIVLHEMLTGVRPAWSDAPSGSEALLGPRTYDAGASKAGSRAIVTSTGSSGLPPRLRGILDRCLAPDPDARFPSGEELERALDQATRADTRRRAVRKLAVVGGVLAMAGAAAGVAAARGLPRVLDAQGSASGTFPERGWILVADVDALDDEHDVGVAVREALAVDLQQSRFVNVMSRAQVAQVLRRMDVPVDAPLDLPLAMEVAERFGAGAVFGTTVTRAGSRYILSARALDPATGEQLLAVRTAAGTDRVLGAVERLSREVRARLGEDPAGLARSLPLPDVTTPSLEALRLYAEAERALARNEPRTRMLVRAALEVDSTFAMAHRLAAAEATQRLRFDEVMTHIEQAYRYRERLPERERRHVEAIYHSNVSFQPRAAAEAYELLLVGHPDDARAWHNLGVTLQSWMGEHERAFEAFARAAAVDSTLISTFTNGTSAAYLVGHAATADSMATRAEAAGISGFALRWRVARAFAEGDPATVVEGCAVLLDTRPSIPAGADDTEICGSMDAASGRFEAARTRLLEARTDAMATERYRNATQAAQGLAVADLLRGDQKAAAAHIAWVPAHVPAEDFHDPDRFISRVNLAVQAELLGFTEAAAQVLAAFPAHPDPEHWFARAGEALIEAARAVHAGDGEGALATLERGMTPGHTAIGWHIWEEWIRGLAHARTGDLDSAARHLRAAVDPGFLTSPFATKDRIHLPLVLAELASVEERRGDAMAAEATRQRLAALAGVSGIERIGSHRREGGP